MAEYNSAHTGPEIDAAVSAVKTKQSTWDNKQDKITGKAGQVVGFDASGNPIAQEAPSGGASSWNDLKDKPVVFEPSDTLTWDGNTEGLVSVDLSGGAGAAFAYRLSESAPSLAELKMGGASATDNNGTSMTFPFDDAADVGGGIIACGGSLFCVVPNDNSAFNGVTFPVKGFYTLAANVKECVITIPGYTGFVTEKLDPAYLPKHTHSWNDLADKPFGDTVVKRTIIAETEMTGELSDGAYVVGLDATAFSGEEERMVIEVDGVKYDRAVDTSMGVCMFGNLSIAGGEADTGEPFCVMVMVAPTYQSALIAFSDANQHTVSISEAETKKIDKVYIPTAVREFYSEAGETYLYTDKNLTVKATKEDVEAAQYFYCAYTYNGAVTVRCAVSHWGGGSNVEVKLVNGNTHYTAEYTAS